MSHPHYRLSFFATVLVISTAFSYSAIATPLLTPISAGSETPLSTILQAITASDGISLERAGDDKDEFWALSGRGTVTVRARFAGYNNIFGVIPGTDGGINGFQALISSLSSNGISSNGGGETFIPELTGDFRLAIRTPQGQLWSSRASDNVDLKDHMVTWVDANDPLHYFVAFEDLRFPGGDGDFNDMVLELRNVVDGPLSVPEPATLALFGIALAGLGFSRRKH